MTNPHHQLVRASGPTFFYGTLIKLNHLIFTLSEQEMMSSFYLCCHLNTFSSTPPTEGKKRRLAVSVRMSAPGGRLGPKRLCFCPPCRTAAAVVTHTHTQTISNALKRTHTTSRRGGGGFLGLNSPCFWSVAFIRGASQELLGTFSFVLLCSPPSLRRLRSPAGQMADLRDELNHTWRTDLWLWRKFLGGHESES